jgi:SDR family mycofactocin-dependent oxidoreductase
MARQRDRRRAVQPPASPDIESRTARVGRLTGKVVVISGAARGQGREHAVQMAREGAEIVAFDICAPLRSPYHPGATQEDLAETQRLVEIEDRRCLTKKVDARDLGGLRALAGEAYETFGRIDTLVVNHGIYAVSPNSWTLPEEAWQESIDVLLTGAWKTTAAFIPRILDGGRGGSVILTSSVNGLKPQPGASAYTAAKHGVLGLMKTLAWELGEHKVRVNAVCPGAISTPMTQEGGTHEKVGPFYPRWFELDRGLVNREYMHPSVISKAMIFLASDDAENITGTEMVVDAGWTIF